MNSVQKDIENGKAILRAEGVTEPIPCKGNLGIWNVPDDIAMIVKQAKAAN